MKNLIIVRGGGDIATGTIYKLKKCGFSVLILEIAHPSAIRRNVAFSEAVYEGYSKVEDMECFLAQDEDEAERFLKEDRLTMLIDPKGNCLKRFKPVAVVDAILAKKNLGTTRDMAPITIALGPGFTAGQDCDAVVETMRGHKLGRVIYEGKAIANTGIPGMIGGYAAERVIHAPAAGILHNIAKITDIVEEGQPIAWIEGADGTRTEVPASLSGLLRGLIREGYPVTKGFKMADIDPRLNEYENCFTISDKARCIAGGVVEAYFVLKQQLEKGDTTMYVIAIVGAGGKTSRIKNLTKEYAQQGKRVLVTTTTHMGLEPGMVLSEKPEDIRRQLEKQNVCICGSPVKEGKIASLPKDIYEQACQFADIVLVEADGSKHMPIKFPAAHEPVIPENVNEIQVVMGLHAIGHPFCEVSHRLELVKQCLNVSDTDLVTKAHLEKLYLEGYQKPLQEKYPNEKIGFFPADHSHFFDSEPLTF